MLSSDKIATAKSFSRVSKSQSSSFQDKADPKTRYLIVGKQQRQMQRDKVRKIQEGKRKIQQKVHKQQLLNQLIRKKKELSELQKPETQLEEKQSSAVHNARVKKQKDKLKKTQKQIFAQSNAEISKDRQKIALKRLQKQKKQRNFKQAQAQQLRKTHCETQQYSRSEAIKFNKSIQKKRQQRKKVEQAQEIARRRQLIYGLKQQGIGNNKNNSSSQQVIILPNQNEQENEAMIKAQNQLAKQKTLIEQKNQDEQNNRRKATQRGKIALARMQKRKQFEQYCQDVAKTQVQYNLSRIQAGKKNQFAGVKPLTFSQMELNKKLRGEEEFERQFFKGKKVQKTCQLSSKYTIFQTKMKTQSHLQAQQLQNHSNPYKYTRYGQTTQTRLQISQPNRQKQQLLDSINTSVKANHYQNNSYSESQDSLSAK